MTDIQGNYGVNTHKYDNMEHKGKKAPECPNKELSAKDVDKTNLNDDPNAVSGRAMVNSIKKTEDNYKFDPKNVEDDTESFAIASGSFAMKLAKNYEEMGYSPEVAARKAAHVATSLLMPIKQKS